MIFNFLLLQKSYSYIGISIHQQFKDTLANLAVAGETYSETTKRTTFLIEIVDMDYGSICDIRGKNDSKIYGICSLTLQKIQRTLRKSAKHSTLL